MIQGVAMIVPGYGAAFDAGLTIAQPIINMVQLQLCVANGFITPQAVPAAPVTVIVPASQSGNTVVKLVAPAQVAPSLAP
jgi:hypothetical protein